MAEPPPSRGIPDLGALYLRYRDVLWRVAQKQLPLFMHDRVGEVVSHVFMKLGEKPPTEPVRNWEALLVDRAKKRAIDVYRKEHFNRFGQFPDEDAAVLGVADGAAASLDASLVSSLLSRLEPRRRRVLVEVVMEGRPAKVLAAEWGVSEGRVSQLKTDALKRFKVLWEQETGGVW